MMKRLLIIILCIGVVQVVQGQLNNTAHVLSMGGGVSNGGNFQSVGVAGEGIASSDLAVGGNHAVYAGFVPANFVVLSFGLEKDSSVLAVLYSALGGDSWTENDGWLQSSDLSSWKGVTVENQRVTALELPGNNLQSNLPEIIKNLSKLKALDISNNEVRKLPELKSMPELTSLKVASNRLGFESLIKNNGVSTYEFAPQKRYGFTRNDTVSAGSNYTLSGTIPGRGNQYQWVFDDLPSPETAVNVSGATTTTLQLQDVDYSNMGAYRLTATNPELSGLTIETRNMNVWAATDIYGKVYANDQGTILTKGQVEIYRIYDGPYELSDSAQLQTDGTYLIDNVVLGDFILLVKNDDKNTFPNVIQTYYISNDDWLDADTLFLREQVQGIDIDMQFVREVTGDPTGADFVGLVESDFDENADEEEGRINARRKVKRAGCSIRRFVRGGRGLQDDYELYAYVESDEDGNFAFNDIEEGTYRLNIQYPGVPMDPDSDIEFVIGGDVENQLFEINATITEDGIVVKAKEILSTPKPYLKNVRLYPNPTPDELVVDFLVYRKLTDLKGKIIDLKGATLLEQELSAKMGVQQAVFDMEHLPTGMYFLEFTDAQGSFRQQVKVGKK